MDCIEKDREYKREDGVCMMISKGREDCDGVSMDRRWRDVMALVERSWQN